MATNEFDRMNVCVLLVKIKIEWHPSTRPETLKRINIVFGIKK